MPSLKISALADGGPVQGTDQIPVYRASDPTKTYRTNISGLLGGLRFKGEITVAADFPTLASVENGFFYKIAADVTDNDPLKTNTGQSFKTGDFPAWNGVNWTDISGLEVWLDDGVNVKTQNAPRNLDMQGGAIKDLTNPQLTLDDDVTITGVTNAARTIGSSVTGTTYTFALTDKNDYFEFSNATGIAVTLEANSVIAFGVGNEMEGRNSGAGAVVITPAVGVTINGATSTVTISSGAFWALKQITVDSWHFIVSLSSSPTFTDLYVTGKLTVDGLIDPTALVLTPQASPPIADNGTVYYNSDGSFKFRQNGSWATSSAFTWSVITAGQSLVKSNGYFTTGASQLLLPLPTLSQVGDTIEIKANNANGFKITQGAGQVITQGNTNTTVGITGFLESTAIGDSVRIVCSVANTQWDAFPIIGVLNGFI